MRPPTHEIIANGSILIKRSLLVLDLGQTGAGKYMMSQRSDLAATK